MKKIFNKNSCKKKKNFCAFISTTFDFPIQIERILGPF